jgi:GntR family transcriptional repressor for pyruvate dehydrogenase complex
MMAAETGRPEAYRALADAIADEDPDRAGKAAHDLLEPATAAMVAAITSLADGR